MLDIIKVIFLIFFSGTYGLLSSAGVFTVLVAVGLVPRFAGRTHTAKQVFWYEEWLISGTFLGCLFSIFGDYCYSLTAHVREVLGPETMIFDGIGTIFILVFGVFSGMFIGCLALAIAEMLDSIPILARRISFRHGLGIAVLSMAAGKFCGSMLYFITELYKTAD